MSNNKEVERILDRLLKAHPDERNKLLESLTAHDESLFKIVSKRLKSVAESEGFLEGKAGIRAKNLIGDLCRNLQDEPDDKSMPGIKKIGPYILQSRLGSGGMGTVYRAVREDGLFEQQVAVKLIRHGILNSETIKRFRQEQQILASLQHKNIARLYDGGVLHDGTPYIVMEYIDAPTLSEYVKKYRPGLKKRLELFAQICEAVHFAHQNLVVHRDLKPSNILVNEQGEIKLLDFGIAKLIDQDEDVAGTASNTTCNFLSGSYASPEQVQGSRITTASDLYSLGLILYKLVAGRLPYKIEGSSLSVVEKLVCHDPVDKPSSKFLQKPARACYPGESVAKRVQQIKGDLDTIILKAVEKDPGMRYLSAQELAGDLRRFINHEPVKARKAGIWLRARKFIRRNRPQAAVTGAFLVLGLAGFILHNSQIKKERDEARLQALKFEQIAGFMTGLFDFDQNFQVNPQDATIVHLLDKAVEALETGLHDEPQVKAELLSVMAESYISLGLHQHAHELMQQAVALLEALPQPGGEQLGSLYYKLAGVQYAMRHRDRIETVDKALKTLEKYNRVLTREYANSLWLKGTMLAIQDGASSETDLYFDRYLDVMHQLYPPDHQSYATAIYEHAVKTSDPELKEQRLYHALDFYLEHYGRHHHDTANIYNSLAFHLETRNFDKCIEYLHEALDIYLNLYGEEHIRTIITKNNIGGMYRDAGRFAEALPYFEEALDLSYGLYDDKSSHIGRRLFGLGSVQVELEMNAEAEKNLGEALEILSIHYETGSRFVELTRALLGTSLRNQGREEEGLEHIRKAIENLTAFYGEDHPFTNSARQRL